MINLDKNKEQLLIDQNKFSEDGTVAITNFFPDSKNKYIAYTLTESGSDRQSIFVYDTEKNITIEDVVNACEEPREITNVANSYSIQNTFELRQKLKPKIQKRYADGDKDEKDWDDLYD